MALERSGNGIALGSEENDVRVEDYLNDKLQTHADLEGINLLLDNIRDHQAILKQQVSWLIENGLCF